MEIPPNLLHEIQSGRAVLFLGAGASVGAKSSTEVAAPTSPELARMIAERFLGGQHTDDPLSVVAELAESEADLFTVQEFIRSKFKDIRPAPFHFLLPTFKWAGIATTNFDLVIEQTYEQCAYRSQDLVPIIKNGDRVEERLRTLRSLMFLKLHGCITRTSDASIPLILSTDQYITHMSGRSRVFDHLKTLSYENTIIFVGHSLQDLDIRQMLLDLSEKDGRPRYFTVTPQATGPQKRFWESKTISCLEGTFEDFLTSLDKELTSVFRGITTSPIVPDLPISERFVVRNPGLSLACSEFLENDVEYVRSGLPTDSLDPKMFYRGVNPRWAAVESELDVRRDVGDTILSEAVLEEDTSPTFRFYAIKGHAGSGKSVLLQRVAWEAANTYGRLCLYMQPHGRLSFDALAELSRVIDERIYLFIDDVADLAPQALNLVEKARRSSLQLTVFAAERINEWNMSCDDLDPYLNDEFQVKYLSSKEIDLLLTLLEKHRALFRLDGLPYEGRRQAFVERAGRQLLVALHEATLGKPFEDIIEDEFAEITPELAKSIYLGVCFLNRYDVPVRAGIINRIYGIRFTEFQKRFFQPLESLIFTRYDNRTRDFVYVTRHSHIAEIVVDKALSDARANLDMHLQMIGSMNIDYDADRTAFRRLVRGRSLQDQFPDHQMVNAIYNAAYQNFGTEPYLLHQEAVYEMNRLGGNLQKVADLLNGARALAPYNSTITHSLAELQLKRYDDAMSPLEAEHFLREAEKLSKPLATPRAVSAHGFNTLAKVQLERLRMLIESGDETQSEFVLSSMVRAVEEVIQQGLQKFPGDSYLLNLESQLATLLADHERALTALKTAFQKTPQSPFIAVRLAKLLVGAGNKEEAIEVYRASIESGVTDKQVHFNYAKLLLDENHPDENEVEYHLRRGFTEGDANIEAQFWYATAVVCLRTDLGRASQIPQSEKTFVRPNNQKRHSRNHS